MSLVGRVEGNTKEQGEVVVRNGETRGERKIVVEAITHLKHHWDMEAEGWKMEGRWEMFSTKHQTRNALQNA